ncbi:MAG: hypothetical protein IPH08_10485 [Rhodocyclaceae bacterium]|nr:hypothetical protein [Rhodocyclaceae bacterium]
MANDYDDFAQGVPWAFPRDKTISSRMMLGVYGDHFPLSDQFQQTYPTLTTLLQKARITELSIGDVKTLLLGWTDDEGNSLGWQSVLPLKADTSISIHPTHQILLQGFGGILERWNEPEDTFLLNLNCALGEDALSVGFNDWDDYITETLAYDGRTPTVDSSQYRTFALEANGDCTAYDIATGRVLLFAHDHSFDNVQPLEGYSEYTLYTINGITQFTDWVEAVSEQWLQRIA